MPFLCEDDMLSRILKGETPPKEGLPSLFDRHSGHIPCSEDDHLDYKMSVEPSSDASMGELARDILGFSNARGGILLIGVDDSHLAVGCGSLRPRELRDLVGPYMGTRVTYDLDTFEVRCMGKRITLAYTIIPKTETNYPHLLRKDVTPPRSFIRKPKYLKGTLFFRSGSETLSESPLGDIDGRARELGFSGAAPRTSTSFQVVEDRPLLRLYSQINDRFFGREREINQLVSEFDGAQGRGVSIGGFGGLGKTELAINLVARLHKSGRFKMIYSASAKQTVLGSTGIQQADPVFIDLKSFLLDFCGWLGLSIASSSSIAVLKVACLQELIKHKANRILVFVDNLETVRDRSLFEFLDNELPSNCWLLATSRVHRLRRYLLPIELGPMNAGDDAARLLRHELKRQGLAEFSGKHINELAHKAKEVLNHPLAIRWYAWLCKRDPKQWDSPVTILDLKQIEEFCVSSTLNSLGEEAQKVLCSVLAIGSGSDANMDCIRHVISADEAELEAMLWDLECSGMLVAATNENGLTTYSVAPMAHRLAGDIAREKGWERDLVLRFKQFTKQEARAGEESPLLRDLLAMRPSSIRALRNEEKEEIIRRIERAIYLADASDRVRLLWRKAECARHLQQDVTADEIYSECAETILKKPDLFSIEERWHILLEAATVTRARAATRYQIEKAIRFLLAAEAYDTGNTRLVGMLAELYGALGNREKVKKYSEKAQMLLLQEDPESAYAVNLSAALTRARENLNRPLKR